MSAIRGFTAPWSITCTMLFGILFTAIGDSAVKVAEQILRKLILVFIEIIRFLHVMVVFVEVVEYGIVFLFPHF